MLESRRHTATDHHEHDWAVCDGDQCAKPKSFLQKEWHNQVAESCDAERHLKECRKNVRLDPFFAQDEVQVQATRHRCNAHKDADVVHQWLCRAVNIQNNHREDTAHYTEL